MTELPLDLLSGPFHIMELPVDSVVIDNWKYALITKARKFKSIEQINTMLNDGGRYYVFKLFDTHPTYVLRYAKLELHVQT